MYPTIFHLPILHIPIYGYGLMMVMAFLSTQWLASRLAIIKGLDGEVFVNVALVALVAGVIGSRASHVLENWSYYTSSRNSFFENLWNMINIRSGGLTFYGGLLLAAPVVLAYLLYKKVPPRLSMDIVAPCVTLGLAVGRVGCFLNGCCYGAPSSLPWAVQFPYGSSAYIEAVDNHQVDLPRELRVPIVGQPETGDHFRPVTTEELLQGYYLTGDPEEPRVPLAANARSIAAMQHAPPVHPAQLYSTITALLVTAVLLCYFFLPHQPGRVFALMLMLEGPTRFLLEMLRVEPPVLGTPMSLSMLIGILLFVVGVVLWLQFRSPVEVRPALQAIGAV